MPFIDNSQYPEKWLDMYIKNHIILLYRYIFFASFKSKMWINYIINIYVMIIINSIISIISTYDIKKKKKLNGYLK